MQKPYVVATSFQEAVMSVNWDQIHKFSMKWIVPAAAAVAILAGLFEGIRYVINAEVSGMRDDIGTLTKDVAAIKTDAGKTNERIDGLLGKALERAFPTPTANKATVGGSLGTTDELLRIAKEQNVKLNPKIIQRYGEQVTSLTNDPHMSRSAWETLGALLVYRTFLNASAAPVPTAQPIQPQLAGVSFYAKSGSGPGEFTVSASTETVPFNEGARIEPIAGLPAGFPPRKSTPRFLILKSSNQTDQLKLDGMRLKNAIIQNFTITYDGGPVILNEVYFVNCVSKSSQGLTGKNLQPPY